jgi:hypothetical protein
MAARVLKVNIQARLFNFIVIHFILIHFFLNFKIVQLLMLSLRWLTVESIHLLLQASLDFRMTSKKMNSPL